MATEPTPQKHDFGTLQTEAIVRAGLQSFHDAPDASTKAAVLADLIVAAFDDYYTRSRSIPRLAQKAFEARDWPGAVALSQERIAIFSLSIRKVAPTLADLVSKADADDAFWASVESHVANLAAQRYEKDLMLAYLAGVRRKAFKDVWIPISHERGPITLDPSELVTTFKPQGLMTADLAKDILAVPGLDAPFRNSLGDAEKIAERINSELSLSDSNPLSRIDVVKGGFFRNRGAYIVGAMTIGGNCVPLALALVHGEDGVFVDAVITRASTLSHVFSTTLANMHVPLPQYHELVDFMATIMPGPPRGIHYSSIGYNHIGKLAVMRQITSGLADHREVLDHAPGPRGSVAMGFTAPSTEYVMKVIRDTPTANYKWGEYAGRDAVLNKYRRVHEINRSGSMLDNIIYSNITVSGALFEKSFLAELADEASETVEIRGGAVFFSHLIVQRKLTPLPLYLERCSPADAETAVIRLGQCIRNNAATNTFNKDLDGRNYGVSNLRFVYLFDYDAVEDLTDVKVRTNVGREEGEEDIPDWFFEDGTIFLPEEIELHLRLPTPALRRLFREAHGEMLTVDYWTRMQTWLREGRVPRVRTYPRATQLSRDNPQSDLVLSPQRE